MTHAPPGPPAQRATDPVDVVLSSFGWVVLAVGSGVLAVLSPAALLAGLACGPNHTDPAICTPSGSTTLVLTIVVAIGVLVIACTVGLVGMIVAFVRGGRAWPWVVAAFVVVVLTTLVVAGVIVALTT